MRTSLGLFLGHNIGFFLLEIINTYSDYEIRFVVTTMQYSDENPKLRELCSQKGIALLVYENMSEIQELDKADFVFLFSWKYIFSIEQINYFNGSIYNLHYSLLPANKGSYPVNQALLKGHQVTGFTIHKVDKNIDSGLIAYQQQLDIRLSENTEDLSRRIDRLVLHHAPIFLEKITRNLELYPQKITNEEPMKKSQVTNMKEVDLNSFSKNLDFFNLLRSMTFPSLNSYPYIIDHATGKRILIKLVLEELNE